ncbi:electron transfer flavoprotein subunit beta/FixA family protein [Nesterenkonia ebinurensis]|uniref:electron transfer flavoprotein subunit beta/FixA family protein n=1 Tax=Nesterenkonia ebinurensis TaxID=2608252 RepID=UPI00168ACE1F|nr:electron transfer flavoprotein subunit beta/FixA family protein [Nesterenkonia ebinurensis]
MPGSLHIITLVKWVPDSQLERSIGADRRLDRSEGILGELDEYPLEAALQIAENYENTRVTALTMGPAGASTAVKKALQIGADDGVHLHDEALAGADVYATSAALAAAVNQVRTSGGSEHYLVLTGMASEDGESGAVPAQLAARLGVPVLTQARGVVLQDDQLQVERLSGETLQTVAAPLPVVVSVTDQANEPRYPNFRAMMKAKKKPVAVLGLAELGLTGHGVESKVSVVAAEPRAERTAGRLIHDDGTAGRQIADFLAEEGLL